MWNEIMSNKELELVDTKSSSSYVYLRELKEKKYDSIYNTEMYYYSEFKIPKDVYEIFTSLNTVEDRLDDVEEILASVIGGTNNG